MKRILLILMIIFFNFTYSQTQRELNNKAKQEHIASDNELNFIYKSILTEYKKDTTFIKNLKNSQRLWVKFRDAELKVKYPKVSRNDYGSVYPMCKWIYLKELTESRSEKLLEWIIGTEEGNMCKGSIKIKSQ